MSYPLGIREISEILHRVGKQKKLTVFCFENDWKNQFPDKERNTNWIIFHKTMCV